MSIRIACTAAVVLFLLAATNRVRADDKPMQGEEPKKVEAPKKLDAPARVFRAPIGRIEVRSSSHSGGTSVTRSTINGVTKLEAREGRAITRITEDPNEGVTVETTKTYDRSNMDELKDSNPNVYNYLEKAPQGMGPTKIRVSVEVGETYNAKSVDELKENHPKAHDIYQKYMKDSAGPAIRGFPRIRIDAPAFDVFPKGIEIKPERIELKEKPKVKVKIES
jgi:hypothetical protein